LLLVHGVSSALRKTSVALLGQSLIQLFASAGHLPGALLEHRPARVAEIGPVLPQAEFDPGRVQTVASAEPEGVGRARGSLLRVAASAEEVVAQSNAVTTAIQGRLVFEIMSDHSFDWCRF
jgi:hypothetical protein